MGIVKIWNGSVWYGSAGSFHRMEGEPDECAFVIPHDPFFEVVWAAECGSTHAHADHKLRHHCLNVPGWEKGIFRTDRIDSDGVMCSQSMAFYAEQVVIGLQFVSSCVFAGIIPAAGGIGEAQVFVSFDDIFRADFLLLWCGGVFGHPFSDCVCGVVSVEKTIEAYTGSAVHSYFFCNSTAGDYSDGN